MKIVLSSSKQHLLFFDTKFDNFGLVIEEKRAANPVPLVLPNGEPAVPEDILAHARNFEWEMSGEPNDGWYPTCVRTGVINTVKADSVEDISVALKD
jgi:hypothetical protein